MFALIVGTMAISPNAGASALGNAIDMTVKKAPERLQAFCGVNREANKRMASQEKPGMHNRAFGCVRIQAKHELIPPCP